MPYIKKLVMKGFKSFARETEIVFTNGMNVIVGPNGSGKSNITEALCFVLGRKSAKSMRAEKSANFIFSSAHHKPMWEASVKILFDNSDKKFSLLDKEISVERIVRRNGVSIYKINNEIKNRQEVLELLMAAGINPYGFNIVLQGDIMDTVKMSPEDRRKVIEEVSGISVYEQRKEKSISELEKTEEKLRETEAVLRERTTYLRNLEEERKQALHYQELQTTSKRCKASILSRKIEERNKQLEVLLKENRKQEEEREKLKRESEDVTKRIQELEKKSEKISKEIEVASGIEQEKLYNEMTLIRAELAGLSVKKENIEERLSENSTKIERIKLEISKRESEEVDFKKGTSEKSKLQDLDKKRKELEILEKEKEAYNDLRTKFKIISSNLEQKSNNKEKIKNEINFIFEDLKKTESDLEYHEEETCKKILLELKKEIENNIRTQEEKETKLLELEKEISADNSEIISIESIKKDVKKIDKVCPLCRSQITEDHIKNIEKEADEKIWKLRGKIETNRTKISQFRNDIIKIKLELVEANRKERRADIDLIKLIGMEEKKKSIKNLEEEEKNFVKEVLQLENDKKRLEKLINEKKDIEEVYNNKLLELQEVSSRSEKNIDFQLENKQIELQKFKISLKQLEKDKKELEEELLEADSNINDKQEALREIENKGKEFEEKNKKLIDSKSIMQQQIQGYNKEIMELQNKSNIITNNINNMMVDKARINAEKENLETDIKSYEGLELFPGSIPVLEERLQKSEISLAKIGSINMRALEVYESIKKEYDVIYEKVTILRNEKEEISKIIEEIDKKKTKTFMRTLNAINELMNRNFVQLSTKGEASLELENPEKPFEEGLTIKIKIGKGKYFDVSSLSGGEKTLVALSLIFAIQEYKPFPFYVFDEVDAALDKRNSEKLAFLIKKYMKSGQYIVVTHNDSLISEAPMLYGVSMQEGISKIISLEI
jgi:chromosome segregation protein